MEPNNQQIEGSLPYSQYPLVLSPTEKSGGGDIQDNRSFIYSYTHDTLFDLLKEKCLNADITDRISVLTTGKSMPYEPDIAIIDRANGIFIDVETDVPYHDYYRFPMNYYSKDFVTGEMFFYNKNRDDFFRRNGWHVIRFSERQIAGQPEKCADFITNILLRLQGNGTMDTDIAIEKCWSITEAVKMEKEYCRENYLGIQSFPRPGYVAALSSEVMRCAPSHARPSIVFNEATHTYSDVRDTSGAANYISVTSLIERFFPHFDEEAYIEKYMAEGNTREQVIEKMTNPSKIGTQMHEQIEKFLKGREHDEDFKEFGLFKNFYEEQIRSRNLAFYDAEMQIALPGYNIAGTVDSLFRKPDGDFVMVDWKRSKKLIINGYVKKYGYGNGLSILSHLDNSSYYHYELQQSFYKYILEHEYGIRISSMILCVLHEDYDRYYAIRLSDYREGEVVGMIAAHAATYR